MKSKKYLALVIASIMAVCSCGQASSPYKTEGAVETKTEVSGSEAAVTAEPREYIYSEFLELCQKYDDEVYKKAKNLSELERYGVPGMTQENENKAMAHAVEVYGKIADEILKGYEIHRGQKVIITGILRETHEVGGTWSLPYGTVSFAVAKDDKADYSKRFDIIRCRTNDKEFLEIPDGTPVKICGEFAKYQLMDMSYLFDCEVLEILNK